jgi:DNA-binding NarL/FixJ family response regulator
LLETEPDYKVIGEAADGAEAVKVVRQLKPDILFLDNVMPEHSAQPLSAGGMYALRELNTPANPIPVRVILLPSAIEKSEIVEALQLGARGIVLKQSVIQVLFKAIQTVMADGYWMDREQVSNLEQYLQKLIDDEARRRRVENC